jgi:hypothetical protein
MTTEDTTINDQVDTVSKQYIPNVEIMDSATLSPVGTLRPGGLPLTHMDGDAAIAHIEPLDEVREIERAKQERRQALCEALAELK